MSHVNVPMPSVTRASKKFFRLSDFTGGLCMANYDEVLLPSAFPHLKNLLCSGGIIKTREGIAEAFGDLPKDKTIHSRSARMFFGSYIIHIGNSLYAFNMDSQNEIYSEMPDVESFVFEMNSKLYFFTGNTTIYILDKDYNVTLYTLPTVEYITGAKYNLSEYTQLELPDNCLIGAISASYSSNSSSKDTYTLPIEPDESLPIKVYKSSGAEVTDITFTVSGAKIVFNQKFTVGIKIVFFPKKDSGIRNFDKILNCRSAVCYGGENSEGNRVFFYGNPDYPGYYFYSDLLDPLTVPVLSYDIIGNGSEDITALVRCKDDLIAFSDTRTDRITYSFDTENGASFKRTEISANIGCNMPGSIQLVDNRLVFAHSEKGIYIIVSSDYTDEMSVRSISRNINGKNELAGFFANSSTTRECCSVDFERTYRLFVGKYAYVWDYANTPFVATEDPAYAEKVLSWYLFELPCVRDIMEINRVLCCICDVNGENKYGYFSNKVSRDFGTPIVSSVTTGRLDFSMPEAKKVLCELYLTVITPGGDIMVSVLGDKDQILSQTVILYEGAVLGGEVTFGQKRICLSVPKYESVGFTLDLECRDGVMGIKEASFKYISDGIYCR